MNFIYKYPGASCLIFLLLWMCLCASLQFICGSSPGALIDAIVKGV